MMIIGDNQVEDVRGGIAETIGKTPLVRLARIAGDADAEVLAKIESFNPGGSVKDRVGLAMNRHMPS